MLSPELDGPHIVNLDSPSSRKPRRLRERLKQATQEAILEAAEQAFARDGALAARMESIALAAGVAVGTLYNHFEDRDALIDAVMRGRQATLLARLDQSLQRSARAPFSQGLEELVGAAQSHFGQCEAFLKVLMEAEHLRLGPGVLQPGELMKQIRRRVDVLVQRGVRAGTVRADDADAFAWFILGALKGLLIRQMKGLAGQDEAGQRSALVRFVLRGVEAAR
jgi:AcrR family transcriptional regulator